MSFQQVIILFFFPLLIFTKILLIPEINSKQIKEKFQNILNKTNTLNHIIYLWLKRHFWLAIRIHLYHLRHNTVRMQLNVIYFVYDLNLVGYIN